MLHSCRTSCRLLTRAYRHLLCTLQLPAPLCFIVSHTLMCLSADVGHFYNMKRKSRGRTATNYFVGGSIGGMLGSGGFGNGSGFRDYMNGGGIFGSGRSQSYMGPAHNPGNASYSGYGADVPGGSGGGGGGDTFGSGGCSHFNGGRC